MSRNEDIERLIELGEKEMYIKKNYEEAEKKFLLAKEIDPSYRTYVMSYLLDFCKEKRNKALANSEENSSKELEVKIINSATESEDGSRRSMERGGKEALHSKSPNFENPDSNRYYIEEIGKGNREISELKSKENRSLPNIHQEGNASVKKNNTKVIEETNSASETEDSFRTKRCENYQGYVGTKDLSRGNLKRGGREPLYVHNRSVQKFLQEEGDTGFQRSNRKITREEKSYSNLATEPEDTQWTKRFEYNEECGGTINKFCDVESGLLSGSDIHARHEQKIATVPTVYEKANADYSVKGKELEDKNEIIVKNVETELEMKQANLPIYDNHGANIMMQDEKETEILHNSLKMRSYVLLIGIKVFGSKPNFRPDISFEKVAYEIEHYILQARHAFHRKYYDECELYISNAEKIYSDVAIILPQASISKHSQGNPSRDTSNALNSATNKDSNLKSVSYKEFVKGDNIDVIKCLKLAEAALNVKDFKKSARLIQKSERICPTKNAQELLKRLQTAEKEVAADLASQKAQKDAELAAQQARQDAELVAKKQETEQKAKEKEVESKPAQKDMYVGKHTQSIQSYDNHEARSLKLTLNWPVADECMLKAKEAFEKNNFTKAENYLLQAKCLNPELDIEPFLCQIRIALASRSSTAGANDDKLVFQPENDRRKQNSNTNRKMAESLLKNGDILNAERYLLKAKEYYNSNQVRKLLDNIQELKSYDSSLICEPSFNDDKLVFQPENDRRKQNSNTNRKMAESLLKNGDILNAERYLLKAKEYYNSNQVRKLLDNIQELKSYDSSLICEPSFVNSNSENHFAYNPGEEKTPSYHLTWDEIEECLKKARFALTTGNLEEAEEFALKCKSLSPVRAQGILQDIEKVKELRHTRTLRSGHKLTINNDNESAGVGVAQKTEELITAAEMEFCLGNLDKASELLDVDKEAIETNPRGRFLFEKLQEEQFKAVRDPIATNYYKRSTLPQTVDVEHNIEESMIAAEIEYSKGNLDRAYELINNDESLKYTLRGSKLLKKLSEVRFRDQSGSSINLGQNKPSKTNDSEINHGIDSDIRKDTKDAVESCIDKAKEAYYVNNFNDAERFLQKAYRICPDKKISQFIDKIHKHMETKAGVEIKQTTQPEKTHSEKHSDYQNEQEIRKCLDIAEKAYNEKDFDKAERLFVKALRMNPCNYIEDYLKKVRDEKNNSMKNEKEEPRDEYAPATADIDIIAERYTNFAVDAMESKCYFVAEKYLEKANYLFTNDTTTELLKSVREKISKLISNGKQKRNVQQTELEKEKRKELQIEAEKYLKKAKEYLNRGDLANAQSKALISDSFDSSSKSRQLFKDIFIKKYELEKKCPVGKCKKRINNLEDINKFKSEQYIEIAEHAIKNGDYNLAEEYLVESKNLDYNPKASKMLENVRAMASRDAGPSSRRGWVQRLCETFF